jgi:hypothetical protein
VTVVDGFTGCRRCGQDTGHLEWCPNGAVVLRCGGMRPDQVRCGRSFRARAVATGAVGVAHPSAVGWRQATAAEAVEQARAAGWSVPADAPPMCQRCRGAGVRGLVTS